MYLRLLILLFTENLKKYFPFDNPYYIIFKMKLRFEFRLLISEGA